MTLQPLLHEWIHLWFNNFQLITQVSTKFPHRVIYSTLLPRADIPIYMTNYINQQPTASCSKLPNDFLVGHENLFAYGSDVLHDDRHIKKRHIGFFATNLINAVRGTDACPSSKKYIYAQSATAYGKIACHTATRYKTTKLPWIIFSANTTSRISREALTISSRKKGARTKNWKIQWRYSKWVHILLNNLLKVW